MSEYVSNTEELEARIELLTRECDDRRRRCAMLARAHGALADAGCVVPTEMDETIEHAINALAKERDEARAELDHACREGGALYEAKIELAEAEQERDEARSAWQSERCLRLSAESALAAAELHAEGLRDAYRRGAEAMRMACIGMACAQDLDPDAQDRMEARLLALPIPEDKP